MEVGVSHSKEVYEVDAIDCSWVGWVDPQTASEYIAGMILLGVAPCTAMVFVWSQLTKGDPNYTLVQVSVNDIIMVFLFAPLSALLLGVSDIQVGQLLLLFYFRVKKCYTGLLINQIVGYINSG